MVRYDCQTTNDPQGRCDHIAWPRGAIRQAKIKRDGGLHLATTNGNFDLYGDGNNIQRAFGAVSPLASGRKE